MFSLFGERVPYCYDMDFDPSKNAIVLNIHDDFIESMPLDQDVVKGLMTQYRFSKFSDFSGNFGFDDAFLRQGKRNKEVKFLVPIPKVSQVTEEAWMALRRTAMSFAFFTDMARYAYRGKTSSTKSQLLALFVSIDEKGGRISIGGDYSPALCGWFKDGISRHDLESIEGAMQQTYYHIWDGKMHGSFDAYIDTEGRLTLKCPCDGEIYVLSSHRNYMEFSSGQIPNIPILMTLLAGLATVNGIARREI